MDTLVKRHVYCDLTASFMTFLTTFVRRLIQSVCLLFAKKIHSRKKFDKILFINEDIERRSRNVNSANVCNHVETTGI